MPPACAPAETKFQAMTPPSTILARALTLPISRRRASAKSWPTRLASWIMTLFSTIPAMRNPSQPFRWITMRRERQQEIARIPRMEPHGGSYPPPSIVSWVIQATHPAKAKSFQSTMAERVYKEAMSPLCCQLTRRSFLATWLRCLTLLCGMTLPWLWISACVSSLLLSRLWGKENIYRGRPQPRCSHSSRQAFAQVTLLLPFIYLDTVWLRGSRPVCLRRKLTAAIVFLPAQPKDTAKSGCVCT